MAVIGVDFDHTLVHGETIIEYAKESINILREAGHKIVIHSANNKSWIERVLNRNDIRYDSIWCEKGKPNCDLLVDDKGYHFRGDWKAELPDILTRVVGMDNRKW